MNAPFRPVAAAPAGRVRGSRRCDDPPMNAAPETRDLRALPKAHLHLHLEGAMRPSTLRELADAAGVAVPPIRGFGSFGAFAGMYVAACDVLTTPESLVRLVDEV